jgi:hypothetical protein
VFKIAAYFALTGFAIACGLMLLSLNQHGSAFLDAHTSLVKWAFPGAFAAGIDNDHLSWFEKLETLVVVATANVAIYGLVGLGVGFVLRRAVPQLPN